MMFVLITVDARNFKFDFWNELVSEGKVWLSFLQSK